MRARYLLNLLSRLSEGCVVDGALVVVVVVVVVVGNVGNVGGTICSRKIKSSYLKNMCYTNK